MSKGWHDPKLVDSIYCEGESIDVYDADFGKVCFLICGDLFEDELAKKVSDLQVDYLLFPFARSFYDGQSNLNRWKDEVFAEYIKQIKLTGTTTLATNYIDTYCFGGAFVVSEKGEILYQNDLMKEGIFFVDLV
jgi:N-carbamoylputrescine amidase